MKMRVVLPIALAVVAGLGCVMVINRVLNDPSRRPERLATQPIVAAASALTPGQTIDAKMIQIKLIPVSMVPKDPFTETDKLIGRVVRAHVPAGYPLTSDVLEEEGGPVGLAGRIPAGYVAIAIKVDEWSSVAGFVVPGSRVNVMAHIQTQDAKSRQNRLRTILQNVEVVSVGSAVQNEEQQTDRVGQSDRRSVTLLLTPRDAEVVNDPRNRRLILALRGSNDRTQHETPEEITPDVARAQTMRSEVLPPGKPGEGRLIAPDRYVTWEVNGDRVEQVIYILMNGRWQRENSENLYNQGPAGEDKPLPEVKENADETEDSADSAEPGEEEEDEGEPEDDIDE